MRQFRRRLVLRPFGVGVEHVRTWTRAYGRLSEERPYEDEESEGVEKKRGLQRQDRRREMLFRCQPWEHGVCVFGTPLG